MANDNGYNPALSEQGRLLRAENGESLRNAVGGFPGATWDGKLDRYGRPIVNVKPGEDIPLEVKIQTLRIALEAFTAFSPSRKKLEDELVRLCLEMTGGKEDE